MRALTLLLALAVPSGSGVLVERSRERVHVRAEARPLCDVLDALAAALAVRVVYDGPPPRTLVTLSLEADSPVRAALAVLEGLGQAYVLRTDPTGRELRELRLVGPAEDTRGGATPGPEPEAAPAPPTPENAPASPPRSLPLASRPPFGRAAVGSEPGAAPPEAVPLPVER